MSEHPYITGLRRYFELHPEVKPATISARIGDKSTIRKMLDGTVRTPTLANAVRIAEELGTTVEAILSKHDDWPPILVAGRVGAGALVPLHDSTGDGGIFRITAPDQLARHKLIDDISAVEVEGESMVPMYQPGDILFFSRATHEGIPDEDVGRPCIVEDADGNAWVKQVKRGDEPGLFHLISLNPTSETKHNQRIKWAARVIMALPAEMVERA